MNSCHLLFEPNTFDAIVSFDVLEHVQYKGKDKFVAETARVLKPDGVLFIGCPNGNFSHIYNPSHYELDRNLFTELISSHYSSIKLLGQALRIHDKGLTRDLDDFWGDIKFDNLVIVEEDIGWAFGFLAICRGPRKDG